MRATEELDRSPHEHCAAPGGALRSVAMWLRAGGATVRLVVLSALGVIAAVLALAPLTVRGGPTGRRMARLPAARPSADPAPEGLADRPASEPAFDVFLGRRTGEGARR